MSAKFSRRNWLAAVGAGAAAATAAAEPTPAEPFRYCFNPSTIMGQKRTVVEQFDIAATAGYHGLEPWVRDLDTYAQGGGSIKDLGRRARDRGLAVEDAIGFVEWIVDDDARRRKGLEEAKRVMAMLQELGCRRLAAPPAGAQNQADLHLLKAAERYAELLKVGDGFGVTPIVEHWGHSKTLRRLGEAVLVAVESGHPKAAVLTDVFHLYKGGSSFRGIKLLSGATVGVVHVNDYPGSLERATVTDAARVYPGDGVAPLAEFLRDLRAIGYAGVLSLELFNREYWKLDPYEVAKFGLAKLRAVVKRSLG